MIRILERTVYFAGRAYFRMIRILEKLHIRTLWFIFGVYFSDDKHIRRIVYFRMIRILERTVYFARHIFH
jgi:hypothetical protein